jgi:Hemerythrin HHE cation binding domain
MRTTLEPADTRINGVVHAALRRDLVRLRATLVTQPYPQNPQRLALGEHAVWLMEFLHGHHTGEDAGVWPLVRERNPSATALLDSLEADHGRIDPAATTVAAAGRRYADTTTDEPRVELVAALDALTTVLFPHLDREVEEAMPVVSASITQAEWRAVERMYFIKPKSLSQLGMEAHWLVDGIDREGYHIVVHTVPAVPRFILLHGFARAYRRRARARWQPGIPLQRAGAR